MILTRIQIENYKQYQGSSDIAVPSQATIGVIGENGTGKTTLFEAIEWCLYAPRSISPTDVRPRGFTGHTTVSVFLESIDGSQRFVVERVLKKSPSATIYRMDENGDAETLVQGPKQVSDYVATKLIGLSHTAFTATFFTRQKELHLFGDQTPGKRREEVGRLLGLETIRTARNSIVSDRSRSNAEAKAMAAQYARESDGRDFNAELQSANITIEDCTALLVVNTEAIKANEQARIQAEHVLGEVQQRREHDSQLGQQLDQLIQERQSILARIDQIAAELARIDQRAQERARLAQVSSQLEALRTKIGEQERERTRAEQANEIDRKLKDIEHRRRELNGTVRSTVDGTSLSRNMNGWVWTTDDTINGDPGVTRLLGIIEGLDLAAEEEFEKAIRSAADFANQEFQAVAALKRYQEARAAIDKEEQVLLVDGEPRDRIPLLERNREALLQQRTTLHAQRTTIEGERDKTRLIIENLEHRHFGDDCPTCGRPFSEADVVVVAEAMRNRATGMSVQIQTNIEDADAVNNELEALERQRIAIFEEIRQIDHVRQRIQKSVSVLETQQEAVDLARNRLRNALATIELDTPPTPEAIAAAEARVRDCRHLFASLRPLRSALEVFRNLESSETSLMEDRKSLGPVTFDRDAFAKLQADLQHADRAHAAIAQIDLDLARRPDLEVECATLNARVNELNESIARLTEERSTLGFVIGELVTVQESLHSAREAERQAITEFYRSQTTLREAEIHRDQINREQQRLERLAKAADTRQSEADHLELMAKEMTEFERFAASRKVPVLSEYTSSLVRTITDGKYERVEFDQDFGIVVYTGDESESSYAVDTFSGGERDAIVLAARIALSQMIGRQAANPPGFLVLDEVFGSLDTDRRAHLLDLLGTIAGTFDELRQVFIISHVDDVRTSPVLDELWHIEETPEGASRVNNLMPGAEIDRL